MIVYKKIIFEKISFLKNKKECFIFGKGKSLKLVEKTKNRIFICINDSINFVKYCDILVLNDIESFDLVDKKLLINVKLILTPLYPHFQKKSSSDITYENSIEKYNNYFFGDYIIYNLKTSKIIDNNFIELDSKISGANNALDLIIKYLNVEKITTYGIGILENDGYLDFYSNQNRKYSLNYLKMIRNDLINRSIENNIKIEIL